MYRPKHEVKSMYVLRDCCGAVIKCSKKPIPYEPTECETCGDNALKLYKVTYVRANVEKASHSDWVDLSAVGIEWDVVKQIDESPVDVYILPTGYNFFVHDDETIYGERM
jgi:hypothetical protein